MSSDLEKQQQVVSLLEESEGSDAGRSYLDETYEEKALMSPLLLGSTSPTSTSLRIIPTLVKKHLRSFAVQIIPLIVPSFLHTTILRVKRSDPAPLHPTAYLDGLRGVAAFIVVIFHFSLDWYPSLGTGYHYEDENRWFLQLPFIRTIYSGRGMVAIFFVISGYVLSVKTLQLMRTNNSEAILSTLSSSVFRRALRLYLPIIPSSLIAFVLVRYNLYSQDFQNANLIPHRTNTLNEQFHHWIASLLELTNIYNTDGVHRLYGWSYNGHVWTIPVEYRGSIIIFCTLLVVAKIRPSLRFITLAFSAIYNLYRTNWDLFLFLSGATLADLHCTSTTTPSTPHRLLLKVRTILSRAPLPLKPLLLTLTTTLSLLLLGIPNDHDQYPTSLGFSHLPPLTPTPYGSHNLSQKFWLAISAVLLTTTISYSPLLQRPFTTRFAQYLGFISYSLYLLHGHIVFTIGIGMLQKHMMETFGTLDWEGRSQGHLDVVTWKEGVVTWEGAGEGYATTFCIALGTCLVVVIWAADVFTRLVDTPCVRFAGALKKWFWAEGSSGGGGSGGGSTR